MKIKLGKLFQAFGRASKVANQVTDGKKTNAGLVVLAVSMAMDYFFSTRIEPEVYDWGIQKYVLGAQAVGGVIASAGAVHKEIKDGRMKRKIASLVADNALSIDEAEALVESYIDAVDAPEKS